VFFRQLGLPEPDVHLEVGSGTQGEQTARIIERFEKWLGAHVPRPAATLVVGDVNSTMACAVASVKLQVPVIHVEAGLRSFDRTMPEEINRIVTDSISELLLVSEPAGVDNLRREGHAESAMRLVGNVMIDTLYSQLEAAKTLDQPRALGVAPQQFALWTMHRPSNVDDVETLRAMIDAMRSVAAQLPVVFPAHPRTRARLESAGLWDALATTPNVVLSGPLGYLEFLGMSSTARIVVTDSGGLQEESTVLGIPCLTIRDSTERPITVTEGTSTLVGRDTAKLVALVDDVLAGRYKRGGAPALWDGHAGERIAAELIGWLS
jgi:UDP-N-acetylglucosamine 2-epimerase (non-hydrolysing)